MTYKQQYKKERKRLLQFARRAEKRGYMTEEGATPASLIPQRPQKITAGSVRRLQRLTADALYEKLVAVDWEDKTVKAKGRQALRKLENQQRQATRQKRLASEQKARKDQPENVAQTMREISEDYSEEIEDSADIIAEILQNAEEAAPDLPAGMTSDQKTGADWSTKPNQEYTTEKLIINNLETSIQNMHSGATPLLLKILYSTMHQIGEKALASYIEDHAGEINDLIRRYAEAYGEEAVSAAGYDFLDIMSGALNVDKQTYIHGYETAYPDLFLGGYNDAEDWEE